MTTAPLLCVLSLIGRDDVRIMGLTRLGRWIADAPGAQPSSRRQVERRLNCVATAASR
jgi:hypothetical protein